MSTPGKLTIALAVTLGMAPAAMGQPTPPEPPREPGPTRFEDDALRAEFKAALERLAREEAETKRLREEIAAEKAQREADRIADLAAAAKLAEEVAAKGVAAAPPAVQSKRLKLTLSGFIQGDFLWRESSEDQLNGSTGDPLNQTRFYIRRGRLKATADYGYFGGGLEIDVNTINGAIARLIGAEVSLRWPGPSPDAPPFVQGTLGVIKIPFGFEVLQSDVARLFAERSTVVRALFPGEYDAGFRLSGGWRFVRYTAAVMNGDPIGERAFPLREPNGSKDLVGRFGVDTELLPYLSVAAGVSGLEGTGFSKGTAATKDVLQWRDLNENGVVDPGELQALAGRAATPSANFARHAVGGDVQLSLKVPKLGLLTLYGELIYGINLDRAIQPSDPVAASRDLRQLGGYVAATLEVTPYFIAGARYDLYNPDQDATDRQHGTLVPADSSFSSVSVAVAGRYPGVGRLIIELDLNRNHLGRDAAGKPANLKDNALIVRAEASF